MGALDQDVGKLVDVHIGHCTELLIHFPEEGEQSTTIDFLADGFGNNGADVPTRQTPKVVDQIGGHANR
ncbi:MAG: hypothetical protein ACP5P1_09265 [Acidimicrobiales bacterium]